MGNKHDRIKEPSIDRASVEKIAEQINEKENILVEPIIVEQINVRPYIEEIYNFSTQSPLKSRLIELMEAIINTNVVIYNDTMQDVQTTLREKAKHLISLYETHYALYYFCKKTIFEEALNTCKSLLKISQNSNHIVIIKRFWNPFISMLLNMELTISENNKMIYMLNIISNFMSRIICPFYNAHLRRKLYNCVLDDVDYHCKVCNYINTKGFAYLCRKCHLFFCAIHFIEHYNFKAKLNLCNNNNIYDAQMSKLLDNANYSNFKKQARHYKIFTINVRPKKVKFWKIELILKNNPKIHTVLVSSRHFSNGVNCRIKKLN